MKRDIKKTVICQLKAHKTLFLFILNKIKLIEKNLNNMILWIMIHKSYGRHYDLLFMKHKTFRNFL